MTNPPERAQGPRVRRRGLVNLGGAIDRTGAASESAALARALDVPPAPREGSGNDDPDRAHVHGFHPYPARMHPRTAERLVRAFAPPDGPLLDPFAGSGTVLVEAAIAGRDVLGTDLNPLAVMLASRKLAPRDAADLERLRARAEELRAFADDRRKRRAGATRRYADEDVRAFDPHVLLELDSLRAGIAAERDAALRADLSLVLSAILVKFSRKKGDTSEGLAPKRIGAGYAAKFFARKADDFARRLGELAALLPRPRPRARVTQDDATALRTVRAGSVACVVTSPPYAATYDYLAHHALRLRWLGLDARPFARGELGARRTYATLSAAEAERAWGAELERFLAAARRTLRRRGTLVLLLADSEVRGHALRADEALVAVAPRAGLRVVAAASQPRPHFHDSRTFARVPRKEHAVLLECV